MAGVLNWHWFFTDPRARTLVGRNGEFAILTGALSAANQNEWIAFIKKRLAEKYPRMTLATIRPTDDDRDKAFLETQTILKVYPKVRLVMAISAPAVPGAGEAIRQSTRRDVDVIGLSLPTWPAGIVCVVLTPFTRTPSIV